MNAFLLIVLVTFMTPQGGMETRRIERPIANAQACAVALAHVKAVDYRPAGAVVHFEAGCLPVQRPPAETPRARLKERDT